MIERMIMVKQYGFSLIELAVVMMILGLLLGGLLGPLSNRTQLQRLQETESDLALIKQALISYAIRHGRLPCPDTNAETPIDLRDGLENNPLPGLRCGQANGIVASPNLVEQRKVVTGFLPYKDLGIGQYDSYGNAYIYTVSLSYADMPSSLDPTPFPELTSTSNPPPSGACELPRADLAPRPSFSICSKGGIRVLSAAGAPTPIYDDLPFMVLSRGASGIAAISGLADQQENTDGDRSFVQRYINTSPGNEFDDVLMWVPAPVLGLHLIQAGVLP